MITDSKTYQKVLTILKNNLVFTITTTATIISTLLSSILYLCHELTLQEWNISPSLVDNPYSNNGIQMFIIIMIFCLLLLLLQLFFIDTMQYVIDLIKSVLILTKKHINIKPFNFTKHIIVSLLKLFLAIFAYTLFVLFCSTILYSRQNHTPSTIDIRYMFIYCMAIPTLCLASLPSEIPNKLEQKVKTHDKKRAINEQDLVAFFLRIIKESHQTQSATSKIMIATMSIIALIFISVCLLIFEPLSVRRKTDFWLTEIDGKTYIVPYASKEIATVKEAIISDNRICIDLNSQMITSISSHTLRYQKFDVSIWGEGSCKKQTIYDFNYKLQQSILDGLDLINKPGKSKNE